MKSSITPSQERLKELFEVVEGKLIWKVSVSNRARVGDAADKLSILGYVRVGIDNRRYLGHRLIWKWHYGVDPTGEIDHINRDTADNRIENLRDVSHKDNDRNQNVKPNNTSGFGNISWCKRDRKWTVRIKDSGTYHFMGRFDTIEEALSAKFFALDYFGYSPNHGI